MEVRITLNRQHSVLIHVVLNERILVHLAPLHVLGKALLELLQDSGWLLVSGSYTWVALSSELGQKVIPADDWQATSEAIPALANSLLSRWVQVILNS